MQRRGDSAEAEQASLDVIDDLVGGVGWLRQVVEEQHVGLHPLGVEDAGGQPEDGVKLGGFEELLADDLPCPAFEGHVVRQDYGGAAGGLEHRADVLEEVELLVGGGGPEILAVVSEVVPLLLPFVIGEGHSVASTISMSRPSLAGSVVMGSVGDFSSQLRHFFPGSARVDCGTFP